MDHVVTLLDLGQNEDAMYYIKANHNHLHPLEGDLVELAISRGLTHFLYFLVLEMHEVVEQKHLFTAVSRNQIPMVKLLVNMGFVVNVLFSGRSPLGHSSAKGNVMMSRILLKVGADVNAMDYKWSTPLLNVAEYAPYHKVHLMMKLLLTSGADERLTNSTGESIVDVLEVRKYHDGKARRILDSVRSWRRKKEFSLVCSSFLGAWKTSGEKPKRRTRNVLKRRKTAERTCLEDERDVLAVVFSFC